jgi:excisionase family DNA binding protein
MNQYDGARTLRVKQVTKILNVPRATVYGWIATGALPSIKIGRVLLIAVDDLEAFLARHRRGDRERGSDLPFRGYMYRRALLIEGCTRDHFFLRAEKFPPGPEQELCREFAAEEEDHIALLESELEHYQAAQARA